MAPESTNLNRIASFTEPKQDHYRSDNRYWWHLQNVSTLNIVFRHSLYVGAKEMMMQHLMEDFSTESTK